MKNLLLTLSILILSVTSTQCYAAPFIKLGDFKAIQIGKDSITKQVVFKIVDIENKTVDKITKANLLEEIDNINIISKKNKAKIKNSIYEKDGEWYFKMNRLLFKLLQATVMEEDELK